MENKCLGRGHWGHRSNAHFRMCEIGIILWKNEDIFSKLNRSKLYHRLQNYDDTTFAACPAPTINVRQRLFFSKMKPNIMLIVRSLIIGREGSGPFNGQTPMLFSIFPFDVAHENFSSCKVLLMVNLPFCSEFFCHWWQDLFSLSHLWENRCWKA